MGYRKIFWGLLFLFDLRIQGIDFLPDIVGYILILQGLRELLPAHFKFEEALKLVPIPAFLSIFTIYQSPSSTVLSAGDILLLLVQIIITVFNLLIIYNICQGIAALAKQREHHLLESQALSRWKLYLAANILVLTTFLFFIFPALAVLVAIPAIILVLISILLLMGLMRKAEDML